MLKISLIKIKKNRTELKKLLIRMKSLVEYTIIFLENLIVKNTHFKIADKNLHEFYR